MGKEYIPLFLDFNESTKELSDEECGRLIRAIVDYANDLDYQERLIGQEKIAFPFLKGLVDRNIAISKVRSQARTKKNKEEENETNDNKNNQNESNFAIETKTKKEKETKTKNKDKEEKFDRFWSAYPRKEAKPTAKAKFEKLNPSEELLQTMLDSIEKWKQTDQWQEEGGKFIPHPATWINQRRWEDEPPKAKQKKAVVAQQYGQRDYSGVQDELMDQQQKEYERRIREKQMKKVNAQLYEQRDYSGIQDELIAEQDKEMEEYMKSEKGAST